MTPNRYDSREYYFYVGGPISVSVSVLLLVILGAWRFTGCLFPAAERVIRRIPDGKLASKSNFGHLHTLPQFFFTHKVNDYGKTNVMTAYSTPSDGMIIRRKKEAWGLDVGIRLQAQAR
jgi:hypothetical protein